MKQSSIEWLMEIDKSRAITIEEWQQAKEMHKDEIENAVKQGWDYNEEGLVQWMGETYYNETFNTK
jgi:hypothetical protein